MLREYYQSAFASSTDAFFTIIDAEGKHSCFQLLSYRQAVSLLPSFRCRKHFVCKVTMMMLETWADRKIGGEVRQLYVFEVEDPPHVDLGSFIRAADSRRQLCRWTETESDVSGCLTLIEPQVVTADAKLSEK